MRVALVTSAARGDTDQPVPVLDALIWRGVEAAVVAWDDRAVDWASFDLAVLHAATYEIARAREFLRWLQRADRRTRLANPASLVEWNLDRRCLRDLAGQAVPIVPTTWVEPGDLVRVPERGDLVVKPAVPTDVHPTSRYHLPDDARAVRTYVDSLVESGAAAMIQPYLPGADERGELDLVYFDGAFSHAVRRVGGDVNGDVPTSEQREVGDRALAAIAARAPSLYARIDLLDGLRGEPLVVGVELGAPELHLDSAGEDAIDRLADAIARWSAGT